MNVIRVPLVMVLLVLTLMSAVQNSTIVVILVNVQILKVRAPRTDFFWARLKIYPSILAIYESSLERRPGRREDPK